MSDRRIRVAQRCSAEEAAIMMAAISAFGEEGAPPQPGYEPPGANEHAARSRGPSNGPGPAPPGPGRSGTAVTWTRSELSLGRGI